MKKQSIFKKEDTLLVIQPLFNENELNPWWHYKKYSQSEIEKINQYFTSNNDFLSKDLGDNVKLNMKALAKKIGVLLPPIFAQEDSQQIDREVNDNSVSLDIIKTEPNEVDNNLKFFILNSQKLDYVTIKMLNIALLGAKIKVLRINNNVFDMNTLNELIKLIQVNKIVKLFFDWNDIEDCQNKEYFYEVLFSRCVDLELVTLRNQNINDQMLKKICSTILENNSTLKVKVLDFFQNQITNASLESLFTLLSSYTNIQYLGLGANHLSQLTPLINRIGKKVLSSEELQEYRRKEQERDAIIQRNLKQKGKNQEEVPVLDVVKDIGQDKFAYFYNEQLQHLNLIQNEYSEQDKDILEQFLANALDGFTLSISANNFEKKTIDRFKKKFGQKIQFY
ncbi:hypothetical protein TTHERM_00355430 (macronuclear) [Tetrahymena thermophila SB210]|uniref:Uncharacterized protein n=1 Tax=Tetrahymena thermophila (strain SB210) TaxID=312017 RepID=Q22Y28_TETTS|nr:hypothetical protein TTHERM_00355430 [Tetrahymena thermophila SB210]EAR90196.2 hypothetical protein TTHERM_00355430 [Tetrahymena thermophila SB210]|eukprot:XP_001010441.2 hypothetical protein TTHERM_00355430 [Tetrahymena thermophila SB210]